VADEGTIVTREGGHTGYPRGTRAEIIARGLDPKNVMTCSQHIEGINAGCPYFSNERQQCIFSHVRNAEAGPVNVGFYKRIGKRADPNKIEQGFSMPCYLFMGNEYQIWKQQHLSNGNFSYSTPFLNEGDKVVKRLHVPRHPTIDTSCHRCRKGDCNLTDLKDVVEIVPPFRRPDDAIPETLFPQEEAGDTHFDLAQTAEADLKTGGQLEELVAQRRNARKLTERVSGTPGT
jgi:hypothetical protein